MKKNNKNSTRKRDGGLGDGQLELMQASESQVHLAAETQRRYINYALSVITSRALPDVRDGLKPVQRRILYGMHHDLRLAHDAKYQKCAQVVGAIMGRYHPHGDASIYEALARMAQDFSLRYPLIEGHGNFGSLDGDAPAAYRYTECRLEKLADELLSELSSKTVDFRPSYDGTRFEPIIIPSKIPQLLMNGTTGIAVGMATNIPPHNLGELTSALLALIENAELTTKELLRFVKGPDFPTGGRILNSKQELLEIYETGQGGIRLRGEWKLEALPRGGQMIIIHSIPYAVNKSALVSKFGEIIRERQLPLLVDVRDESTTDVRIVLEIKREADPELVMAYLYKHTPLSTKFNVNMTCLIPTETPDVGMPKRIGLKEALQHFLKFRFEVVRRRLEHHLAELRARLHILEGFEKVYDALDEVLRLIRKSDGKEDASQKLQARFKLDMQQADAILEMKLYRLAKLEILIVEKELKEKAKEASRIEALLKKPSARWTLVAQEISEIGAQYTDKRRTKIGGEAEEVAFDEEAFIADEDCQVVLTKDGWIKRVKELKSAGATRLREGDSVAYTIKGTLKSALTLFSNLGKAYTLRCNDVPASVGYGDPIQKLFRFEDGERVVGALSVNAQSPSEEFVIVTRHAYGMRMELAPFFEISTRSGRRFVKLQEGDEVLGLEKYLENCLLGFLSKKTASLVFRADEVAKLANPGRGVKMMSLGEGDEVAAFLCSLDKGRFLNFETRKKRKLRFQLGAVAITSRGGKGREMSKNDAIESISFAENNGDTP
ncbi:MAG: DNA topoisomerase IV subunit A [Proteobacteria bacterium]|nr:DNA topoisomerase IV subunit A [Cystobacterineae bacterium]MCL2258877.1 DNA topoisomerase IV subunit A [Cystobacterineae bacterium]MCL2314658.1 DNA topoisomerase IV subunit A [Pseudomonadota bacterium]